MQTTFCKETSRHECVKSYAGGGLFCQYKMMQKCWKMIETLAYGYSFESTLSYQMNTNITDALQKCLYPCALDERSINIGRVKHGIAVPIASLPFMHPPALDRGL